MAGAFGFLRLVFEREYANIIYNQNLERESSV